jgi:lipopolysaccharide export system permease protein
MIYDHITYPGNNRVILSDSSMMYSILDNRYLVFELFNGNSFTEIPSNTNNLNEINQFYRNNFSFMKMVFDMSSFDLKRTKEELFAGDYRMKNIEELSNSIDSLEYNKSKQRYVMLKTSSAFYDYHMKNNFIFPKDVKYIRGELNESDKVLDFYSKKSKEIFFDKNYYDSLSKKLRLNSLTYTRALNSARNIKTNLSINAARIKSQEFEINKNETELIKKYAQAFACISMFLVGAPLGALIKRGGLGIPVIISILFYIIYYVLNILGLKWAREDLISPFLAAWMSNLLIFPLGVLLLYLARKDSRIFDYNIIESIKTKFLIFQKKQ